MRCEGVGVVRLVWDRKSVSAFRRGRVTALVAVLLFAAWFGVGAAVAQNVDVTFRYVPLPDDNVVRVFAPGEFNGWGPNSSGVIAIGAPSAMTFLGGQGEWAYTTSLAPGQDYQYKLHFHLNESGSSWLWVTDPNNPRSNPNDNDNSLVFVSDPMVFQLTRSPGASGNIEQVSAGVFGNHPITALTFEINGVEMDGLPHFDGTSRIFRYQLPTAVPPGSKFKLTATDDQGSMVSDSIGTIPPVVVDEPLPPGVRDGITYDDADPTRVTLSLFAPGKSYAHVIGEFNNWTPTDDFLMKRDSINADSVRFWLTIDGITPTVEYAFQYLVDGQINVADPYSPKVLVPGDDAFIGATYPGLKPYPSGQTRPVSVFRTGQQAFDWQHRDYEKPDQSELVIYELLIRDFIADHDFATLIDTLDYLDNLGVNAIELMPVSEFGGNESWGYNPDFHLALDKYYGPADDLKRFVDACHARGIAVILDVVYNHVTGASPFVVLYQGAATESPYLNREATHPFNVFVDVNHESTATRYWLDRANEYWVDEFDIDGYRFDLSKGFTQRNSGSDVGLWSSYDASRIATLKRMADQIWATDSTTYIILEHFADNTEEKELAEYRVGDGMPGMMLWGNMNHNYNEATMGYNAPGNSDLTWGYFRTRNWSRPNLVTYMESHDEQWLMFKNLSFGACENAPFGGPNCDSDGGAYNVRDIDVALDRQKLAGAFFFLLPGPKMMWQFGELGYGYGPDGRDCLRPGGGSAGDCPANAPGRVDRKPIRWNYFDDPLRLKLYKTWSALINLRREHAVFHDASATRSGTLDGEVKTLVLDHPFEMDAVVVGNFAVAERTATPGFPATGTWYNYFTGDSLEVSDTGMTLDLAAGEFHVYTTDGLPTPEAGIITVGTENLADAEDSDLADVLMPAYPNPATDEATFAFRVAAPRDVRIALYDLLGREVAVVLDGDFGVGEHTVRFDAAGLASGVYFYALATGETLQQRKLVIR